VVLSEELFILESCCFRPVMRNSVFEELGVRIFAKIQEAGGRRVIVTRCKVKQCVYRNGYHVQRNLYII